ncbi:MAG: ATP-binding protein [Bacillota bacterium]|uniref:ATP-binding protein n=1 Tax=Desulfurispora thermophila TaxID=265470 RepID=UPI0003671BB6|nr:ATP-binding protein [Desulfurispora thermophila]
MQLKFHVQRNDFSRAGQAAARIKKTLQLAGIKPAIIRKAIIVAYEAELNIVIHAYHGTITANISTGQIEILAQDEGPGIVDIDLAMQEGYSTAPPHIRKMGFGAGMGLPNIKKSSDSLEIYSAVGRGTLLRATIVIGD